MKLRDFDRSHYLIFQRLKIQKCSYDFFDLITMGESVKVIADIWNQHIHFFCINHRGVSSRNGRERVYPRGWLSSFFAADAIRIHA